jgi:hypothetical protein
MLKFKQDKDKMLFSLLHPALIMIYTDLYLYAKEKYHVDLVVTDTISTADEDAAIGRVSTAHQEGRAIDIRTRYPNLTVYDVQDLVNYINTRWQYKKYHYMSRSGVKRLAYYHTHRGEHIHLAIHQRYANLLLQKQVADLVQ